MTTAACVNLHINLPLLQTRFREHLNAFASSCEHHKINEYSCNPMGVLSVTSTINMDYFGLRQSSCKLIITSNARDREHLKAFANL